MGNTAAKIIENCWLFYWNVSHLVLFSNHAKSKPQGGTELKRRINKWVLGFIILLCILATGQTLSAQSKGQVLMILRAGMGSDAGFGVVDYAIIKEYGVMRTTLDGAGFNVVVATIDGRPVSGKSLTIAADYKGLLLPCMDAAADPFEAVSIVKSALAAGVPVAAQNGGVFLLSMAGGLKGKNFAMADYFITGEGKQWFNSGGGIYKGEGVVEDGKIVTSGICPVYGTIVQKYFSKPPVPDGTLELTQKLIALMQ